MRTRSQAKQPTDLVTNPTAQSPGTLINYRQALVALNEHGEGGSSSTSFADRDFSDSRHFLSRCKNSRCKTCPIISLYKYVHSAVIGKIFNPPKSNIDCKSNKLIYVFICENCGLKYVGEKTLTLNKSMNIHRTSKKRM